VLDGGRLLFYIIEAIRRKPLNPKYEQAVSAVFTVLLFGLMAFVLIKDIAGLF
jgi:regulator of sigma E protease